MIQLLYVGCEVVTLDTQQCSPGIDLGTRGGVWKHDPFEELNTHIPGRYGSHDEKQLSSGFATYYL